MTFDTIDIALGIFGLVSVLIVRWMTVRSEWMSLQFDFTLWEFNSLINTDDINDPFQTTGELTLIYGELERRKIWVQSQLPVGDFVRGRMFGFKSINQLVVGGEFKEQFLRERKHDHGIKKTTVSTG